MSFVDRFPAEWLADVIVRRSGGRDSRGNPLPVSELEVTNCLIGQRSTADPRDRSDVTEGKAILYRDKGFTFLSTDVIVVPTGHRMAGKWAVDGRPAEWPTGSEVGLVTA
jgi:hypothetical protein